MFELSYILEVSLYWLVCYAFYYGLLRKETFFSVNRIFLLSALIAGLVLPFLHTLLMPVELTKAVYVVAFQELLVQNMPSNTPSNASNWAVQNWIFAIYWLGVLFFSGRLMRSLFHLYQFSKQGKTIALQGYSIIKIQNLTTPFSFGKWLFMPQNDDRSTNLSTAAQQKIIEHELVHIREWHSLDVLALEILRIVFWFNPLLFLFQTALKEVHEYAADRVVLRSTPVKGYGELLLQQAFPNIELRLIHNFNQSQLKKRIMMMTKKTSSKRALWKYAFIAPLLLVISLLFSVGATAQPSENEAALTEADEMPYFKECQNEDAMIQKQCFQQKLLTIAYSNVKYPKAAAKKGVEGMAVISFVINKDAKVVDIKIVKDPGEGLGEAALEAVKMLAADDVEWVAGKQGGKAVSVEMKLPVKFKLSE